MRPHHRETSRRLQHDTTPACIDAFDDLVAEAATGDRGALGDLATRKFAKLQLEKRLRAAWCEPANEQTEENEESEPAFRKSAASGL
jgi:hypothetical protein